MLLPSHNPLAYKIKVPPGMVRLLGERDVYPFGSTEFLGREDLRARFKLCRELQQFIFRGTNPRGMGLPLLTGDVFFSAVSARYSSALTGAVSSGCTRASAEARALFAYSRAHAGMTCIDKGPALDPKAVGEIQEPVSSLAQVLERARHNLSMCRHQLAAVYGLSAHLPELEEGATLSDERAVFDALQQRLAHRAQLFSHRVLAAALAVGGPALEQERARVLHELQDPSVSVIEWLTDGGGLPERWPPFIEDRLRDEVRPLAEATAHWLL
jgi:hypothetical protein